MKGICEMHSQMRQVTGFGPRGERGAVLIFSLIMLLLLTIIGVTAMQMTTLQERMAGGYRDRHLAFQGAEAALREGERLLNQATVPPLSSNGANGLYQAETAPDWYDFDDATTREYAGGNMDNALNQQLDSAPEYYVERLKFQPSSGHSLGSDVSLEDNDLFRITARSSGGSGRANVVLQSVYKR